MGDGATAVSTAPAADRLAAAHAQLLRDRRFQFEVQDRLTPQQPQWLLDFLKFLIERAGPAIKAAAPTLKVLFWVGLAAVVVLICLFIVRDVMQIGKAPGGARLIDPSVWRADPDQARILLEDADALAAEMRYEEAAHLLLLRGVQDLRSRRPRAVRPALTSREIAASPELPERARVAFTAIAQMVEASFYGGRALDRDAWLACRQAYEDLVFPQAWAA